MERGPKRAVAVRDRGAVDEQGPSLQTPGLSTGPVSPSGLAKSTFAKERARTLVSRVREDLMRVPDLDHGRKISVRPAKPSAILRAVGYRQVQIVKTQRGPAEAEPRV
jgi:hypothetical protein